MTGPGAVSRAVAPASSRGLLVVGTEAVRALSPGDRFSVRISGASMLPSLRSGDEVMAERVAAPSGLGLGALVVMELQGAGLVAHRLLWVSGRGARTRGEGSGRMDPRIPLEDVLGRVIEVRRDGADVTGPAAAAGAAAKWAWLRQFSAAAWHRLSRSITRYERKGGPSVG